MLLPALKVQRMDDRIDLDCWQSVYPKQAMTQHQARTQTPLPQQVRRPLGAWSLLFQTKDEHAHTTELHKLPLLHHWVVIRGAPIALQIYRTRCT